MSKYEMTYEILTYDCNYKADAKLETLFEYMIDTAVKHSNEIVGSKDNDTHWIIYEWDVDIKRYPKANENIKVTTYTTGFYKFYAFRNFEIKDENGNLLLEAKSKWLVLDKDFNITRINNDIKNLYTVEENFPILKKNFKMEKVEYEFSKSFSVRRSDIDSNLHVSNTKYISWLIESISETLYNNYNINKLEITYKNQTLYGETVEIYMSEAKKIDDDKYILNYKILGEKEKDIKSFGKIYFISHK